MAKINSMLDVGKRSLMNSQTALQTVSHNIASKNVEGYSRQRVDLHTNVPIGEGKLRIGMGAKAADISRTNNPFLEKQIAQETSKMGMLQGQSEAMSRVEQVYNEQMNKGLNHFVGEFFNSFRELSNNPESTASRTLVKENADSMIKDFRRMSTQLKDIQKDVDQQVTSHVNEINNMTEEIASLNQKIQTVELTGASANDERDRRDLLIKKLGEKVNIRTAEGDNGMVTVAAGDSALLVSGYNSMKLMVQPTPETETKGEGNVDIFYLSNDKATPFKVTEQFKGGQIGGLLNVRDQVVTGLLGDVDKMAYTIGNEVNNIHEQGFNAYNQTGVKFFDLPQEMRHAAENISLSAPIQENPAQISAAATAGSPGDNRIANLISNLQFERTMDDGNSTIDDYYNGVVGKIGVETKRSNVSFEAQKDMVKQLSNVRESISGVSLDEETTKMIEFQKSFEASARIIKVADEMFDTVLGLKK
jgi:flagellar hook-associated protein 1 FlgK